MMPRRTRWVGAAARAWLTAWLTNEVNPGSVSACWPWISTMSEAAAPWPAMFRLR